MMTVKCAPYQANLPRVLATGDCGENAIKYRFVQVTASEFVTEVARDNDRDALGNYRWELPLTLAGNGIIAGPLALALYQKEHGRP